jgi:hypothetical protein
VSPAVKSAGNSFLKSLDTYTIEDLCKQADEHRVFGGAGVSAVDFAI